MDLETREALTVIVDRIDALEVSIRGDLSPLKTDVSSLKTDVSSLKTDVSSLRTDVSSLKTDVSSLKTDVSSLKTDVSSLKTDVSSLKTDVSSLKTEGPSLRAEFHDGLGRLEKRMDENHRHANVLHESLREDIRFVAEHVVALSAKVEALGRSR